MKKLPNQIEDEVEGAIQIARESNAEAMDALQDNLETINDEIVALQVSNIDNNNNNNDDDDDDNEKNLYGSRARGGFFSA